MKKFLQGFALIAIGMSLLVTVPAEAQIRVFAPSDSLLANDDGSSPMVNIGFSINFFGVTYTDLYVNNNGNVTFGGPLSLFNPSSLNLAGTPILAPFLADVDTRGALSDIVRWGYRLNATTPPAGGQGIASPGPGAANKRDAFAVNWVDVGYFNGNSNLLNSFQLVIIDRGDVSPGDFDFEFNYSTINWDTGDVSGGSNGVCVAKDDTCDAARVGWSNGAGSNFELAGSGNVNGALLDGGGNALVSGNRVPPGYAGNDLTGTTTSTLNGRYLWAVRDGQVTDVVPEPMTFVLMGTGLIGVGLVQIRRRRQNEEV